MLQNLDKINEDFLLSTLEKYKQTSLYVLADPPYFKQADNISPRQITKLFNIVQPDFAFFGMKDAQQLFILKKGNCYFIKIEKNKTYFLELPNS